MTTIINSIIRLDNPGAGLLILLDFTARTGGVIDVARGSPILTAILLIAGLISSQEQVRADRGLQPEAEILQIISNLSAGNNLVSIPKWIGWRIRKNLRLSTRKSNGRYVLCEDQGERLVRLWRKFDIQ